MPTSMGISSSQPTFSSTSMMAMPSTVPSTSEFTQGKLWLRLFSPADQEVVTQQVIDVTGQAPAETVISLNEDVYLVSAEGDFSLPVTLTEGPNLIELVASNTDGDEIDVQLTVIYEVP